jgi:hypothetical protein
MVDDWYIASHLNLPHHQCWGGHAGAGGGALGDQSFPLALILATAAEASGGASNHTERQRVSMRAVRWVKDDRQKWIERPMISHFSEVLS